MKRPRNVICILAALAALYLVGCGSDQGGISSANGVITGRLFDGGAANLAGVTLALRRAGSTSAQATTPSNGDGYFSFGAVTAGDYVIDVARAGAVACHRAVTVVGGWTSRLTITLGPVGTVEAVDNSQEVEVSDLDDVVILPAGCLAAGASRQITNASVQMTALVASNPAYTQLQPGVLRGVPATPANATPVALRTFGMIDVSVTGSGGMPVALGSGQTATLQWLIEPDPDPGVESIPMWRLDSATGLWRQEGVATRAEWCYRGTINRFGAWAIGVPLQANATKVVRIVSDGAPQPGVMVRATGVGWEATGVTDAAGQASLAVLPESLVNIEVLDGATRWLVLRQGETMPAAGGSLNNEYTLTADQLGTSLFQVTLCWGSSPRDLDSYMSVPPAQAGGPRAMIYYRNKGSLAAYPYCQLDTDDVDGYGPEVTTVRRGVPGVYRFAVRPLGGRLDNAGASVVLVTADGRVRTYRAPTPQPADGLQWAVLDVEVGANNSIVAIRDVSRFGGLDILNPS
ncbi:MAG: carboxypeptidase regulatory-like domain-containing protein [Armatimonadetes bacterium]|nr:carboxypeptidase regulatory-like domain-containing protein [Armatimonadota bacterium]